MKKILCALIVLLSVLSCKDELERHPEYDLCNEISDENVYAITVDQALANLEAFMAETGTPATRSIGSRTVSSITPIKYNSMTTRAINEKLDCENILYVANFENEQGYAILAGDTRIEEEVIAIADEGYLSDATIYSAMDLANAERVIIDDYPTTGAGFFTTPETDDELFINPNTVSLYDETKNDTFVGNFSIDDIGAEDEDGNPIESTQSDVELASTPELVTSSLCASYALNEIREYEKMEYLSQEPDDKAVDDDESSGGGYLTSRTETSRSTWSVKQSVSPILSKFVSWHQHSPFNDLSPKKRKYLFFGRKRKAPAGCFPLAIAKILTHFEYPNIYTYNGYTVNWAELKKSYYSTVGRQSAASLLKGISSGCNSWYFYAGTFTFPSEATSYMRFVGLKNAHSHNYSFDRVTEMTEKGCPLIIYSVPGVNVFESHSWNIDGYKIKERTITTRTYIGDTLQETETNTETCKMVHCDFGWGGTCNGYYVSGVFKLNDPNIEHDFGTSNSEDTNYNNLLKVITYEKP